ncbi:SAM-dependent methyltransferase [Brachybacterium endophyticum]|uniref:SAM-dependent methyltransferase n=1 Tax=Brachybacterium endophyticum TaxID=2182385 RepID=A0A2U2RPF3_9MICO|nr:SAM-dependent methyltransferase [Brachybacterium endophyticum]PWH07685.1 SAM-dependent methyltransferase [Brachybacterium endophyticum]
MSETQQSALEQVLAPEGWALLQSLPPYEERDALARGGRLREAGHPADRVAAVLTQSRLRAKGSEKFGEFADRMLFTTDGLEQATRLPIAALHARRFRDHGITSLADLGCGIGGDAMAAAALDLDVIAVDRDPLTVAVATVNLMPFPSARVELGSAEDFDPTRTEGIWLDPARRRPRRGSGSVRVRDPEEYSPPLSTVADLARRLGHGGEDGPLGAKLGPGIAHEDLPAATETQWLSWHGQVLEATCWFGPLATPGTARSALVIGRSGARRLAPAGDPAPDPQPGPLGDHLYEPDGAVIRAGLLGEVARQLDAHTLDPTIAYLTGDRKVSTPFASGYTVRDVMPFSLKRLTSYLREHRLGVLEIKKRGTAIEPDELRRKLRPRRFGDERATVILTRIAGEQHAIIAAPHPRTPPSEPED